MPFVSAGYWAYEVLQLLDGPVGLPDRDVVEAPCPELLAVAHPLETRERVLEDLLRLLVLSLVLVDGGEAGVGAAHVRVELDGLPVAAYRLVPFSGPLGVLGDRVLVRGLERARGEALRRSEAGRFRRRVAEGTPYLRGQLRDGAEHGILAGCIRLRRHDRLPGLGVDRTHRHRVAGPLRLHGSRTVTTPIPSRTATSRATVSGRPATPGCSWAATAPGHVAPERRDERGVLEGDSERRLERAVEDRVARPVLEVRDEDRPRRLGRLRRRPPSREPDDAPDREGGDDAPRLPP